MIKSLFLKFGMLAITIGVVLWLGWVRQPVVKPLGVSTPERTAELVNGASHHSREEKSAVSVQVVGQHSRMVVDLNRATADELEALPGIGAVLAQRVIEFRESSGRFRTVEDLRGVKGIGAKKFDRLKSLVTVSTRETQRETERRAS
ncbi:MAG: helix-hairpin-helix domain-containing protein [Nitrospira sp.]|nr:helix-hairpin-helix domain-containing protein [Nitrospira sp.]